MADCKRLALISDIHGNYKALEAFLEYIANKNVDGIICLGDYVTDGPYPQRTLSMLREMGEKYSCEMVRGNREEYLIGNFYRPEGWKPSSANGLLYYVAGQVTEDDIHFFESLPSAKQLSFAGCPPTLLCHGTPKDLRGNVWEKPMLKGEILKELKEDYLFGGHTHHQEMECAGGKTYVNPGSLGCAIDGMGRQAQFAMLEVKNAGGKASYQMDFVSIPYDLDSFLRDFAEAGLDECGMVLSRCLKRTLQTGLDYFYAAVCEAVRISGKPVPEISEQVWEQAAERLGV